MSEPVTADERTRVVLGALAAGASLDAALAHVGAKDLASARLEPRAVRMLLETCPDQQRPRCAELALAALRPRPSGARETSHPAGLFLGGGVVIAVSAGLHTWLSPALAQMGDGAVEIPAGASAFLAVAAMLLGLVGIAMTSRGLGARALVETAVLNLVSIDRDLLRHSGLPIPRRRGDAAGLDALLAWLTAATAAGVTPEQLLSRVPTPALGQASAQRLWAAAREADDALSAVFTWAKKEPVEVRNVAARLEGEDAIAVLLRVRRVAMTVDRTNELGGVVSAIGFALLVAAAYLVLQPVMVAISGLGGAV